MDETNDMRKIGERIASIRKQNNLTQSELAEKMNLTTKHISNVERGLAGFSTKNLIEFSKLFDCDMNYILRGKKAYSSLNKLPDGIVEIMFTAPEKEIARLNEYLNCYLKLMSK